MRCQEAIELVKSFESCRLSAYQDSTGIWTLGWGRARDIQPGEACSQAQADAWLMSDLDDFEAIVLKAVSTPEHGANVMNDNQLGAVTSFVFNVGLGKEGVKDGFLCLKSGGISTLLRLLREQDWEGAALEFPKWSKAGGLPVPGLLRRRLAEQVLFLKPVS